MLHIHYLYIGHLNEFNLESEYGTHSTIKRLSGGQKVKLVSSMCIMFRV